MSHYHCPVIYDDGEGVEYSRSDDLPACVDDTPPSEEKIAIEADSYHGPDYSYYTGRDSTWYS